MNPTDNSNPVDRPMPIALTAVWSMMLPGLGQMLKGHIMGGIIWSLSVAAGYYAYFWPGLVLHGLCILDAAFNRGKESWLGLSTWPQRLGLFTLVAVLLGYIYYRNI
jgi:hypothetical protein